MLDSLRLTLSLPHAQRNTQEWFRSVSYFSSVDSTNTYLLRQAQQHNIDGVVVCTHHQSQGKGRSGRKWITPPGEQLALSAAVSTQYFSHPQLLPLAVGLAMYDTIASYEVDAILKWPNDILISVPSNDGTNAAVGKISGILLEITHSPHHSAPIAVLGLGINLSLSASTRESITSMYPPQSLCDVIENTGETEEDFSYHLFSTIITNIARQLDALRQSAELLVHKYNAVCSTCEAHVVVHCDPRSTLGRYAIEHNIVDTPQSQPIVPVPAYARGINNDGELIVDIDNTQFAINAADIEHIRYQP